MALRPAALICRFFGADFAAGAAAVALGGAFFGAAFALRIAAHLRCAASAIAFLPATLSWRFFGAAFATAARPAAAVGALRRADPCKASIARERRSRSAISKETICSVCTREWYQVTHPQSNNVSD